MRSTPGDRPCDRFCDRPNSPHGAISRISAVAAQSYSWPSAGVASPPSRSLPTRAAGVAGSLARPINGDSWRRSTVPGIPASGSETSPARASSAASSTAAGGRRGSGRRPGRSSGDGGRTRSYPPASTRSPWHLGVDEARCHSADGTVQAGSPEEPFPHGTGAYHRVSVQVSWAQPDSVGAGGWQRPAATRRPCRSAMSRGAHPGVRSSSEIGSYRSLPAHSQASPPGRSPLPGARACRGSPPRGWTESAPRRSRGTRRRSALHPRR